jgi:hypothetical protein
MNIIEKKDGSPTLLAYLIGLPMATGVLAALFYAVVWIWSELDLLLHNTLQIAMMTLAIICNLLTLPGVVLQAICWVLTPIILVIGLIQCFINEKD